VRAEYIFLSAGVLSTGVPHPRRVLRDRVGKEECEPPQAAVWEKSLLILKHCNPERSSKPACGLPAEVEGPLLRI